MNSWSSPLGGSVKTATRVVMPSLHEVCRFERSRAAGIKCCDDGVGGRDRLVDDERPSCGSQNRLPNGGNSNGQCEHDKYLGPPQRLGAHAQVYLQFHVGASKTRNRTLSACGRFW